MQSPDQGATANKDPLIQQLMGVQLHSEMTCQESGESLTEDTRVFALKCNITIDVNHLSEGLHKGLEDDREKNSEQLGRLALFKVLVPPLYLTRHSCGALHVLCVHLVVPHSKQGEPIALS